MPPWVAMSELWRFLDLKQEVILATVERTRKQTDTTISPEEEKLQTEQLRKAAREYLPARCRELSQRTGLRCGNVSVRASRTRWGSCSANDNISLSLFLMRLPDELIDFVILHELCHTVHKNHSSKFHALLDRMTGGHEKDLNAALRRYRAV